MIKNKKNIICIIAALMLISCGGKNENNTQSGNENGTHSEAGTTTEAEIKEKKITEKDLVFKPVITESGELAALDSFIVKDFFGLSKDTIQIKFNSDNQVRFFSIV